MAIKITAAITESTEVYQVRTILVSRTVIFQPEQFVLNDPETLAEIKAQAGLPDYTAFVNSVLVTESRVGPTYQYEILLTPDPTLGVATAHTHNAATLLHPLRSAYRDGSYIDLDPAIGPVDIYTVADGTVDLLRVRLNTGTTSHEYFAIDKEGVLTVGGHLQYTRDNEYDIGSADDGTTLYRPRDVYVGRDSWTARDGYFGTSATSPYYRFFPQLINPSSDPTHRHIYWNEVDNLPHAWDGTTDYPLGGGGGLDYDGVVFIDNLTPDVGNIACTFTETGTRVVSAVATPDVTTITTHVFAYTGHEQVRPDVSVNAVATTWSTTPQKEPKAYSGTVDLSGFTLPYTITAVHQDGNTYSIIVSADAKPVIGTLVFVNGYPGTQTELKAGDTFDINVQTDIDFIALEVENSGACSTQSLSVGATSNHTFTANIANRGVVTQALPARVRVQKSTGAWSDWVYTNTGGVVDGTNLVNLNNLYPSIEAMNQGNITYPATQQAIKDTETVTVHSTCTDFDTINYLSLTSELTIPSPTTYVENKAGIVRNSGGYNITVDNYTITANRAANDATSLEDVVVYIAHDFVQIRMTEPASRLRTGGNDGTSPQDHTITLTANQQLISTPTIAAPPAGGGAWQGAGWIGGPLVYSRDLQCLDSDTVGAYVYGSLVATNLANRVTTAYTGDSNYTIGGFVSRTVILAAFANETTFNAAVADYSKCTLVWTFKSLPNKRVFNTAVVPDANSWCFAGTIGTSPTTARILDTAATGSSSNATNVTVEEIV